MAGLTINDFTKNLLGKGIIAPLQRTAGSDFVVGVNDALIKSAINQILATKVGELPWRPSFGTNIETYRHRNMNDATLEMLKQHVAGTILLYEPRIAQLNCDAEVEDSKVTLRVRYSVETSSSAGSTVLLGPNELEVTI